MKITLSKKQEEVVNYEGKSLLVIAGAGSGKTRVLTERIKRQIEKLKRGEKVLGLTFSNKAADELRERLVKDLGQELVMEKTYIGTIHGFCLDIISSKSQSIGLPLNLHICESYEDRMQILKNAINNYPKFKIQYFSKDTKENNKTMQDILEKISYAKRNLREPEYYEKKYVLKDLYKEYDALLLEQGMIDFDDILRYTYKLFIERPNITNLYRQIFKNICIDEAQDLNLVQYEIIHVLAEDKINVTLVGDPNQSIYGFNGSNSEYMTKKFKNDFSVLEMKLLENFRSSKSIVFAAKKFEPTYMADCVCPLDGEFATNEYKNEEEEARAVVEKIKLLVNNGHKDIDNDISFDDCAILARNRYVFGPLEKLLQKENIEYTLRVSQIGSFSGESEFIKIFEYGMRLIVNPKDRIHINKLLGVINIDDEIATFNSIRKSNFINSKEKDILNKAWSLLEKNIESIDFNQSIKELEKILTEKSDEMEKLMIGNDIEQWKKIWQKYIKKSIPNERSLSNFMRTVAMGGLLESNDKGIRLSTVHMSKGLEYNVVFIIGLNEGVFPDYRACKDEQNGNGEQMNEEIHDMFVAITRSKRLCYISYPLSKDTPRGIKQQSKSRFINKLIK